MSKPDIQYFGEDGLWVKPAGAVRVDFLLQGGGAGGAFGIGGLGADGEDGELKAHSFSADQMPQKLEVNLGKGGRGAPGAGDGRDGYALIVTHLQEGGGTMTSEAQEAPADVMAEIVRLREACRTLGRAVAWQARSMEVARIEYAQNGSDAAMQWILNSIPDVSDAPPELQWDGKETATEWLDRVESADRAAEASQ